MRDPLLVLAFAVLCCVGMNRLVHRFPKVVPPPVAVAESDGSELPFHCVASAAAGSVELIVHSPGCFAPDRNGMRFDWKGDRASMRPWWSDGKDTKHTTAVPRAAVVGLLDAVSERALSWRASWEMCKRPWGHLDIEARWTCVLADGGTIRGYSSTDYPLCTAENREGSAHGWHPDGEVIQALVESFRARWSDGPPRYVRVEAHVK